MKKIIIIFNVVLLLSCLTSCFTEYEKETWFNDADLKDFLLEDMPLPNESLENSILYTDKYGYQTFYYTSTYKDVNEYVKAVVNYLQGKQNVFNIALREGHGGLIGEIVPYDNYVFVTEETKFDESGYTIAYSLSPDLNLGGGYLYSLDNPIKISISFTSEDVLKPGFTYNAYISIKQESYPACGFEDYEPSLEE